MAKQPQQGIMALPNSSSQQQAPELSLDDSYDAIRGGLGEADPTASAQVQQQLNAILPALDQLSDEQLDALIQVVQYMHDHEKDYKEIVAKLVQDGVVDEGVFPAEYNPEVIATLGMVFLEARRQRRGSMAAQAPQPPMQLAKGGIADAARLVASHGRYGDTMLAHINKKEAAMLKKHGGSGTINPATGLPEYWGIGSITGAITGAVSGAIGAVTGAVKSVVNGVVNTVKSVVASPIGKVLATAALAAFIGPAAFGLTGAMGVGAQLGLASMGVSVLSGGNLKDALQAGAKGFFLGAVGGAAAPALGGATGVTSAAGQAALGAGAAGTGLGLLTGKGLQGAVKEGLTAATMAGLATGGNNMLQGKDFMTPATAANVKVDPATGKVSTGGQSAADAAFDKDWAAAQSGADAAGWKAPAGTTVAQATPAAGGAPTQSAADAAFEKDWAAAKSGADAASWKPPADQSGGLWDTVKNAVSGKSAPTTQEVLQSDTFKDLRAQGLSADKALEVATKQLTPSLLAQYGAPVAAGLGATALLGGFKTPDAPQMSPQMASAMSGQATRDLMAANPKDYLVQNLPGVQYDEKGNIIGSTPWTPRKATQTEVGSDSYIPFTLPTTYHTPTGSMGSGAVYQPYNTASMYTNLQPPRYAAQGGMMETQGAFPSNPLTMPSSPLMAMDSQRLPMNTPGVSMNTPVGLAKGGIADMAHLLAAQGRNGDTMLAHITPEEARLLEMHGGSGSINPRTGLPEFFSFSGLLNAVKGIITPKPTPAPVTAQQAAGGAGGTYLQGPPVVPAQVLATATQAEKDAYAQALNSYDAQNRSYQAQKMINDRLNAYHKRMVDDATAQTVPYAAAVQTGNQVAQQLNPSLYNANFQARLAAGARRPQRTGIASLAVGGYPRRTGQISGPGTETSDDIPAMLSDGEFVMTAKAVRGMGKGSRRDGAKKMYALMHHLEKNAARG